MSVIPGLPDTALGAIVAGIFTLPTTLLAHRHGMRKQSQDAEVAMRRQAQEADASFDARLLAALDQRDKVIDQQAARIQDMFNKQGEVLQQLGAAQGSIDQLTRAMQARDEREDILHREIADMEARLQKFSTCDGGLPCPFRRHA